MTKREKLVQRLLTKPADFTWAELKSLLERAGYALAVGGKSGGSGVKFVHHEHPPIILHKPHPTPILKRYQLDQIIEFLKKEGLL